MEERSVSFGKHYSFPPDGWMGCEVIALHCLCFIFALRCPPVHAAADRSNRIVNPSGYGNKMCDPDQGFGPWATRRVLYGLAPPSARLYSRIHSVRYTRCIP